MRSFTGQHTITETAYVATGNYINDMNNNSTILSYGITRIRYAAHII